MQMRERFVRGLARAARVGWFRSVEVTGADHLEVAGPALVVANHAGGFVDPVLLMSVSPRPPRFLAMASLFRFPTGMMLRFAGAIAVQRRTDGATAGNVHTFAACHDVLRAGGVIAIFPEGQASDEPHLLQVKTGAARIALGARARGAQGLRIVPVGLIYEAKQSARARAFLRVGEPLDLDIWAGGSDPDDEDRDAVGRLTEEIERRLADAALDFADAAQAADLWFAAEVSLRRTGGSPAWAPALSDLEDIAGRLAEAPEIGIASVRDAATAYRHALDANDLQDRVLAAGQRSGMGPGRIASGVLTVLALLPATIGAVANALPALAVHVAGRRPTAPVTLATIKFLVGFVLFPINWLALRYLVFEGQGHPWVWTLAVGPGCGLLAAVVGDRLRRLRLARLRPSRMVIPGRAAEDLAERRAWLRDQVAAALEAPGQGFIPAGSLGDRP